VGRLHRRIIGCRFGAPSFVLWTRRRKRAEDPPFLWFDGQAAEAAKFYVSVFPNAKLLYATPMNAAFVLEGQEFLALNGGPQFEFTPAISLFVSCASQAEVDSLWAKLTADGGAESECGWLVDKYGLSWQIVPKVLGPLLSHPDRAKAERVTKAMLRMRKLDIATLERAAAGE
jgi:predicted 3-demethylubiquinone-9 3-methyltransferase (glyoxalase superfamily)